VTTQEILDSGRVPLGRKPHGPFSKRRNGYAAKRRFAGVPNLLFLTGALLSCHLGGSNVLSMGCEYSGKLVAGVG
jgi:hypothetical protein